MPAGGRPKRRTAGIVRFGRIRTRPPHEELGFRRMSERVAEEHYDTAWDLYSAGRHAEAEPHARRAAELAPGVADHHRLLAEILLELDGRTDDASPAKAREHGRTLTEIGARVDALVARPAAEPGDLDLVVRLLRETHDARDLCETIGMAETAAELAGVAENALAALRGGGRPAPAEARRLAEPHGSTAGPDGRR